jgi:hypothetical protein
MTMEGVYVWVCVSGGVRNEPEISHTPKCHAQSFISSCFLDARNNQEKTVLCVGVDEGILTALL